MKHHTPSASKSVRTSLNSNLEARSNKRVRTRKGFTLVEIMIVVVIIGLLAAMAIPAFQVIRQNSQTARFVSDLRVFRDALEMYITKNPDYPIDSSTGAFPTELDGYFNEDLWVNGTTLGGEWDLEVEDNGVTVAVGVDNPTADLELLRKADTSLDDGDLSTGKFRLIAPGRYYWVLVD
ncbi:MAG: type II secretion system protein [Opitutales bacterium]